MCSIHVDSSRLDIGDRIMEISFLIGRNLKEWEPDSGPTLVDLWVLDAYEAST